MTISKETREAIIKWIDENSFNRMKPFSEDSEEMVHGSDLRAFIQSLPEESKELSIADCKAVIDMSMKTPDRHKEGVYSKAQKKYDELISKLF